MELFVCRPEYYFDGNVPYANNLYMKNQIVDKSLAEQQHKTLCGLLEKNEIKLKYINAVPGLPDYVFTANAGVINKNNFLASNFKCNERKREKEFNLRWFSKKGYCISQLPSTVLFEGEGDLLKREGQSFLGYGIRSELAAREYLENLLNTEVAPLRLVRDELYHLDTAFSIIDSDIVLYCPDAFYKESARLIEREFKDCIEVSFEDACKFQCNVITGGKKVIAGYCTEYVKNKLKDKGYDVITTDLSEFNKAGGSARCLVLNVK